MRLSGGRTLDLWSRISRLRSQLSLTPAEMAELLHLTEGEFAKLDSRKGRISAVSVFHLAEGLHISMEKLMHGEWETDALCKALNREPLIFPEKYMEGAFSRRRLAGNLLSYVEFVRGPAERERILKHFQLSESFFADPEAPVNIMLGADISRHLSQQGVPPTFLYEAGVFSSRLKSNRSIANSIGKFISPIEVFEIMVLHTAHFDQNHTYKMESMREEGCTFTARLSTQVIDTFKDRKASNSHACQYRAGIIASFTRYAGLPEATVQETSCTYRGDAVCRYDINYFRALLTFRKIRKTGASGILDS